MDLEFYWDIGFGLGLHNLLEFLIYFVCDTFIIGWYVYYSTHSFSALPEHQTLEHLVGDAEPGVPEDQPQVEAARLP